MREGKGGYPTSGVEYWILLQKRLILDYLSCQRFLFLSYFTESESLDEGFFIVPRLGQHWQSICQYWFRTPCCKFRINPRSDSFGFIRIDVSKLIGLSRIDFWPFFIKRDTKSFSDWFGLIRIGSDTDIGMNRNSSDWLGMNFNPILRQGTLTC